MNKDLLSDSLLISAWPFSAGIMFGAEDYIGAIIFSIISIMMVSEGLKQRGEQGLE